MMVYLAYRGYDYEGDDILGIFDNLEAAISCCRHENAANTWARSGEAIEHLTPDGYTLFSLHRGGMHMRVTSVQVQSTFGG
jgi:hypothetical protein